MDLKHSLFLMVKLVRSCYICLARSQFLSIITSVLLFIPGKQFTVRLLTNRFADKCNLRSLGAFLDAMISHMNGHCM